MTIEINLTNGKIALIDDEDFEIVRGITWHADKKSSTYYAKTNAPRGSLGLKKIYMHRLILGLTDPKIHTDHINGNGLDNRRANLRFCSQAENNRNKGVQANNSSGYKGVYWHKQRGKWHAIIKVNGKGISLGLHPTPEAAYAAYCAAAAELHGEFHNLGTQPAKRWTKPAFEIIHTGAPR